MGGAFEVGRRREKGPVTRRLHLLSLAYVAVPVILFLGGYLTPWISVPLILLLAVSLARQLLSAHAGATTQAPSPGLRVAIAVLAVAFATGAGVGGFAAQDGDYVKHNALFKDLMELDWPLAYQEAGPERAPRVLNTYVGYYLPAGLVGKLFGVRAGFAFTLAWAALGLYLAMRWFLLLVEGRSAWLGALLLFFGGLDLLGYVVVNGKFPAGPTNDFSGWMSSIAGQLDGLFWIFPSSPAILANGPHHVLPSWIALLMVMHDSVRRHSAGRVMFLWSTTTFVSAFFALGMLPFLACCAAGRKLRELLTFENTVVAGSLALVAALYVASNDGTFARGFIWEYAQSLRVAAYLALFYAVSIGVYFVFWPASLRNASLRPWRPWLYVAIACIVVFPLYRIGPAMEFPIKAWLPAVIVFAACFAAALQVAWRENRSRAWLAIAVAAIGSYAGVSLMAWAATKGFGLQFYDHGIDQVQRIDRVARSDQLFSRGDSFFWKHLAMHPRFYAEQRNDSAAASRMLADREGVLLHERFAGGEVPRGGYDTRKSIALGEARLSVEVVLRPDARQASPWAVLATNELRGAGFAVQQYDQRNNEYYLGVAGRPGGIVTSPVAVSADAVHYLVFSFADGKVATYLDGRRKALDEAPPGLEIVNSREPVQIGNGRSVNRSFLGKIYELRISAEPMSAEEVGTEWRRIAPLLKG